MKKVLERIVSFVLKHIEAFISGIIALVAGWFFGSKRAYRRKEKELMKTKEALRKLQAEYSALDAKDRKSQRDKKKLEKQIGAYQSRIVQLEEELAQR